MKSIDGIKKQSKDSVEVLEYKLSQSKKDAKKNIIIAILVTGIISFIGGLVFSNFNNSTVNALRDTNYSLLKENESLKALNTQNQ